MFERISNGFTLARSSWRVLLQDKQLLVFPIVSGFLFLLVLVSFAVPLGTLVDWAKFQEQAQAGKTPVWVYPVAFAFYFCTYFVMIFCNSALVSCALMRFNGQEPTLGDGFRMALARLPQIFAWAVVSATVGMLLKVIEGANEKVGIWISSLLGAAWSVMTFFVVPILVVEKRGPIEAVGRSLSLLKKTWGEALVGRLGLGLFMFLLSIPVILLFVGGVALLGSGATVPGAALLIAAVIAGLLLTAVSSAMNTILLTALYQYAAEDKLPSEFDRQLVAGAFAPKA